MLADKTILILNTLLYPVICTQDPVEDVDWVIKKMINCTAPKFTKNEIVTAIDEAISSTGWLDELASRGDHSEWNIRAYLSAIKNYISK